jgi:hypothetical protein
MLFFIKPLRAFVVTHLSQKESCLSDELSFLFTSLAMLPSVGPGQPAEARNFLRVLRQLPEGLLLFFI